ncbi:MAG: O-antigen ligase family protein [Deltaproteobacteria bacterium]|nr:O-antigen ligase family protein [Deltaproteobacteria bacterium]
MRAPSAFSDLGSDPARQLVIPALVALPLALALGLGGAHYMAALAIIAIGGGTFLANPRAFILGFLVLIALRNFVAGGERIGGEAFSFDLGGLVNVLATGIGFVYFLVLWKNPFKGRSLTVPYGAFLGLFALSMYWAPEMRWSTRFVTRLAAPFFTYLIISDMLDRRMVRQVIAALYASSVIPILYGFYQWFTGQGNEVTEGYVRVNSSFFHPAHFSMYLTFLFCLAYAEFLDPAKTNRGLRLAYIVLLVALEISTYTRISWVAMGVCWVYLSWVYNKRGYLLAGAILGGFMLVAFGGGIVGRLLDAGEVFQAGNDVYDLNSSVGWRLYFWDTITQRFWDHPWLGHGAGSSVMLGVELFGIEAAPHNGYLRVAYETGFVGVACFAWVLGTMMWQGFRLIRRQRAGQLSLVSHVYVTMTLTYVLLNATDNILEYYEVAIYQWAILSLVEYNNLRAARAGLIEQSGFEDKLAVDAEAVEEVVEIARKDDEELSLPARS